MGKVKDTQVIHTPNLQLWECTGLEKAEVSEEAKEPERGDRHRYGKDCPTDGLKWGVHLQNPSRPGDQHHQESVPETSG